MNIPIIIVGANLTGLFTAISLSSLGKKSILIDKKDISTPIIDDGRAIALSYGSKEFFEEIGIWNHLAKHAGEIKEIRVTDQYSPLFLHFDNSCTLGYIIESLHLQKVAYELALNDPNITILSNSDYEFIENDFDQAIIKINDKTYKTELLIAADGKFSNLRKLCNIDYFSHNYQQSAIICKVKHQHPHNNIAQEIFLPHGPFAILPLSNPHQSGIVWTETNEIAKTLIQLDKNKLQFFLREKFTNYLGKVNLISEIASYPLELIISKKYYHNRVMLIGDSAHSIHPIAGQGFNLAVRDMKAISMIYKKYINIGLSIGCKQSLSEYQDLRKNDTIAMAIITDGLNKLFSNNMFPINLARKLGLSIVNKIPTLQKFFMEYAMARNTKN